LKLTTSVFPFVLAILVLPSLAEAHCQVPCGIYDDHARVHAMLEDVKTIDKAVLKITELNPKNDALSRNQLVRWVTTKERHASHIISVMAEYFLTQKIKPVVKRGSKERALYLEKLADAHAVMRAAMKCKQTVDSGTADKLKAAIEHFGKNYPRSK
jgi:nickel superoxide dismutase